MARWYETPDFLSLQAEWYQRLRDNGFVDVEDVAHAPPKAHFPSLEEYYRRAGHYLWDKSWESERDREIWRRHAEGESVRQIARALPCATRTVQKILQRERAEMLRTIVPGQNAP